MRAGRTSRSPRSRSRRCWWPHPPATGESPQPGHGGVTATTSEVSTDATIAGGSVDDHTLAQIQHVIEARLAAHGPFPAHVIDRTWSSWVTPRADGCWQQVRAYPGVAELPSRPPARRGEDLLVPLHVPPDDVELRLFKTIATIGAPYDVTLEELCLETLLPANPATEASLRALAD